MKEILGYAGGIALSSLFHSAASNVDYLVIGRWLGMGPLGFYERAFKLTEMPLRPSGLADRIVFAGMSRLQGRREALAAGYRRALTGVSMGYLPLSVLVAVLAPEAIRVLLGPGWEASALILPILALGIFLRAAGNIPTAVLKAVGRVYALAAIHFFSAVLILVGAWYACRWGLTGVAAAVVIVMAGRYAAISWLALRAMSQGWRLFARAQYIGAAAALSSGAAAWMSASALRNLDSPASLVLPVGLLAGTLALALVFFALRRIDDDLRWLWTRLLAATPLASRPSIARRLGLSHLQ